MAATRFQRVKQQYERLIKGSYGQPSSIKENELKQLQNQLFLNFLYYCLPISVIAVGPGVYISIQAGYILVGVVDAAAFMMLAVATFSNRLDLRIRKLIVIAIFYSVAIVLINTLGYVGPGIFYLLGISVLMALVMPGWVAYYSVAANTIILFVFALNIKFHLFNSVLLHDYTLGKWVAFSANVPFLSLLFVLLINKIFAGLLTTIQEKDHLQDRYKSMFNKSPLPMWVFDTGTLEFLEVNEAAINHYGFSEDEFLKMTINDIRPVDDRADITKLVNRNAISGVFYNGHSRHITKNGDLLYIKIQSNLTKWENRKARLVLATDITGELESARTVNAASQRIKESELNLRALFDNVMDGFVLLDKENCIKVLNARAKDYFQLNNNLVEFQKGKSIFEYMAYFEGVHFEKIIQQVQHGEVVSFDQEYRTNRMSTWIRYTLTPVYEEKTLSGLCITGRDITAKKKYVQTIERQNRILREISWMQSHLVRAPLARIMGLTDLLKTLAGNEQERKEIVQFLEASSGDLDAVLRDIVLKSSVVDELSEMNDER